MGDIRGNRRRRRESRRKRGRRKNRRNRNKDQQHYELGSNVRKSVKKKKE